MKRLHKFWTLFSVLLLSVGLFSCKGEKKEIVRGTAEGFKGPIEIELMLKDGKIVDGRVVATDESDFAKPAIDTIIEQAVKNGNADKLDTVSGATFTSKAVIAAIKAAVDSAKNSENANDAAGLQDLSCDVVVVGAGGAGLSAAIAARNEGANVIVLEKMGIAGGNTNYATGGLNAAETSVQKALNISDTVEQFYEDTMKGGKNRNNPDLVKTLTEKSAETVDWLIGLGVDLSDVGKLGGAKNPRAHRPEGGGAVGSHFVSVMLHKAVSDLGIKILYKARVTGILQDGNSPSGVTVSSPDGDFTVKAKAVIIATGGFGANPDLIVSYNPKLAGFGTTNHAGATGDAFAWVTPFNAALLDMDQIQTHPTVVPVKNIMITEAVRGNGAILVNREGKRFVQELSTRDVVSEATLKQSGKTAFLLFDQGVRDSLKAIDGYAKKGLLTEAQTIADLAKALSIPAEDLENTVSAYNRFADEGKDPDFGREAPLQKLEKAPFYAVEVGPAVHHTMGGLAINTNAEVLDTNGNVIKGLYAAGEVTGGVHGANRLGGNAMADIAIFGKIAGTNAAKYVKQ